MGFSRLPMLAMALVSAACATGAAAQVPGDWLHVAPGDTCLTGPRLRAHTVRYLEGAAPTGHVDIRVEATDGGAAFTVERDGQAIARRAFAALPRRCQVRLSTMGLAIALAIESAGAGRVVDPTPTAPPEASGTGTTGTRRPTATPDKATATDMSNAAGAASGTDTPGPSDGRGEEAPPPAATDPGDPTAPQAGAEHADSATERWDASTSAWNLDVGLTAGAGVITGAQPAPAWAFVLGVDLAAGPWSLAISGLLSPHREARPDALATGRTESELLAGRLAACLGHGFGYLKASVCLAVLAGALSATGVGLERQESATIPWVATAIGASARIPAASPLALRVRAETLQNWVQPALRVEGDGGGRATVGDLGVLALAELHWIVR